MLRSRKINFYAIFLIMIGLLCTCFFYIIALPRDFKVTIGITGSARDYPLQDQYVLSLLKKNLEQAPDTVFSPGYKTGTRYVKISSAAETRKYYFINSALLPEDPSPTIRLEPEISMALQKHYSRMEAQYFGEYISWSEASRLFPRKSNAKITDLETGLSFQVQRRAGSFHADVQPLTALDTRIMKKIYNGQWSWRRRAVIVEIGSRRLAASMNGMPHGSGLIKGNNFPGHFCLHFKDSKVHKSNAVDLAHQIMINKAAGKIEEMIFKAQPRELISIFYVALKQHDWFSACLTLRFADQQDLKQTIAILQQVEDIKTFTVPTPDVQDLDLHVLLPASVTWRKTGSQSYQQSKQMLRLTKDDFGGRWYIESASVQDFI